MANPMPNEKECYERIEREKITIDHEIWDLFYNRIGDDITAINLLCQYYLKDNKKIPMKEAEKILSYTKNIKAVVSKIVSASDKDPHFPDFKEKIPMHPMVGDMFMHYIGNDIHIINMIVGDALDPMGPHPIPPDVAQKIISRTHTVKEFMDRLQEATEQKE
ncbi:MAG: hypothetical protein PHR44_05445 [Candidatus Omnitrophica bacterium]|nr:hypothetical protein [Candidatus Omnitrophota bacterium]